MHILLKVMLITISSTVLILMLFDYDSGRKELSVPSKINCIQLGNGRNKYLCNTCFKVNTKSTASSKLEIASAQPFLLVSMKTEVSGILTCEEWLQGIDYETLSSQKSQEMPLLKFQSDIMNFLKTLQNEHNQILLTKDSQLKKESSEGKIFDVSSALERPFQVVSFYSNTKQPSFLKIYQNDNKIMSTGTHILTLLSIAISIALLYVFHCLEKKGPLKKYWEHIFSVLGIFGTLLWILFGDLMEQYEMYLSLSKILFFSTVFDTIFGAGRWMFFGIILVTEYFVRSIDFSTGYYHIILESVFLLIITGKVFLECGKQYFFLQKNSNKKVYFQLMALQIVCCVIGQWLLKDEILGQVFSFLIGYFCLVSFVFGIKNLDGNDYQKLLKEQQGKNINKLAATQSRLQSTTMYEDGDQIQEMELKRKGKR